MVNDKSKIDNAGSIEEPALQRLPELLTVREAAGSLRVGMTTMYEYIRTGQIQTAKRVGRKILIPRSSLERLVEARKEGQ